MFFYEVRSQTHRLISTGFVLKHTHGRALAFASIKPIVTHKPFRILDDSNEILAYPAVNLCTVSWTKVIMTNDSERFCPPRFVSRWIGPREFTEPEKTFLCMDLSRRTRTQNQ